MTDVEPEGLGADDAALADDSDQDEETSASTGKKGGAAKTEPTLKLMATRNVGRARKSFTGEEEEKNAMGEYLMQSAVVYAILELADAVRSSRPL
jgi:hypothetical protein